MNKIIKIALGDLRHRTRGRHSVYIPVGINSLASYVLLKLGTEKIEI